MVSLKAFFAYLLYTIMIAALFLYVLFPAEAVKVYLNSQLSAIEPTLTLEAKTLRPSVLPPGLKITDANLNLKNKKMIHIDSARVSPQLSSLLVDNKKMEFQVHLANGTITGNAIIKGKNPSGRYQITSDLSQVHIDRIDAIQANDGFSLSGVLDGRVKYEGNRSGIGKTNGSFTVSELRIALQTPLFEINEITIGTAKATISGKNRVLRIKSLTFDGPMAEGKIAGTIELKQPLGKSHLNLTGNVKPRPELFARLQETIPKGLVDPRTLGTRGLNFRISGPFDSPNLSMR